MRGTLLQSSRDGLGVSRLGRERLQPGLQCGVSRAALLLTMPSLIALGVALPGPARADVTISTTQTTQQDLDALPNVPTATNAATVAGTGSVDVTALPGTDAIVGAARNWTLTNRGVVSGNYSGVNLNSAGGNAVINAGSITGVAGSGTWLQQGGSVLNQGTIASYGCGCSGAGVLIGGVGTVVNQGTASTIIGDYGVSIVGAGTVTNEGTVSGASAGIYLQSTGIIVNRGSITALAGYGIRAAGNATITNQGTASLMTGLFGGIAGGPGTTSIVVNQGTISASSGMAIALGAGSVFNQGAASTITAYGYHAVFFGDGPGTVTNDGRITAIDCGCGPADGVYLTVGGSVTNNAGALIQGYGAGIAVLTQPGTIVNSGTIIATAGSPSYGVSLAAGGSVTNAASGLISGGTSGIIVQGLAGTIGNGGTITGTGGIGIDLQAGGAVTNQAGGVITGATGGIAVAGGAGVITNAGRIASGAGPAIAFTGAFDNSLTNSGTLTNGIGTTAVLFGAGNDTLTLQTGSRLGGDADGGAGTNTLVLQGTGTESHSFLNFQSIKMSGSSWLLTGTLTSSLTVVELGRLAINGTLNSPVIVADTGTLGGNGTIVGTVSNNGVVAPGNSIGTLTISGAYVQAAGSHYQVEVDASGASDKIVVTGVPGTATLNGGSVDVVAASGTYAKSTTYSILTATGGITGTYAGATSSLAFLLPSLSYDGNNVLLTLTRNFAGGGVTANQRAVGTALDQSTSTSADFQTALGSLEPLSGLSAQNALDQLGGESYGSFASVQMRSVQLFAGAIGQQMAQSHGSTGGTLLANRATRIQLAAADATSGYLAPGTADGSPRASPWTAWSSAFGVSGGVAGDGNAHDLGYTLGGAAFGLDRRIDPTLVVGAAFGYARAETSLSGLPGRGTSNVYQAVLYASYSSDRFYLDGLAGYGYDDETMKRNIAFDDLSRSATGDTHAHQVFAALETGYAVKLADAAVLTPYAGLQAAIANQPSFVESGADALDLAVESRTTSSLRGILGAGIGRTIDMTGWENPLSLQLRAGWAHEFGDTERAVTASLVGAPGTPFTVQGARSGRDSAVIGLAAQTALSADSSLFLRYDGDLDGADNAHSVTGGIRITW
jgi:fibronectin-binding autotransporter adhesin